MQHQTPHLPRVSTAGATILATADDTAGAFVLVSYTLAPYSQGRPLHRHSRHVEGCYVVAGTLALTCAERTVMLSHGSATSVPPGVEHTWWNPTADPVTLLLIFAPGASRAELADLLDGGPGHAAPPLDSS